MEVPAFSGPLLLASAAPSLPPPQAKRASVATAVAVAVAVAANFARYGTREDVSFTVGLLCMADGG